jgi:hypothetical protein
MNAVCRLQSTAQSLKKALAPGEVHRAASAVAAQRTQTSVGIVVVYFKVRILGRPNGHEAVGTYSELSVANVRNHNCRKGGIQRSQNDYKIVATAMVLHKSTEHGANLGSGTVFGFPFSIINPIINKQ